MRNDSDSHTSCWKVSVDSMFSKIIWKGPLSTLNQCGLLMPYGVIYHHWFRYWLAVWWHHTIIWTMLTCHLFDHKKQTAVRFGWKCNNFHSREEIWKCICKMVTRVLINRTYGVWYHLPNWGLNQMAHNLRTTFLYIFTQRHFIFIHILLNFVPKSASKSVLVDSSTVPPCCNSPYLWLNKFPPEQNGRHFTDNIFKCIFMDEKLVFLL